MEGIWSQKGVKGKDTKYMYLKKINSHSMIKLDNWNETEQSLIGSFYVSGKLPTYPFPFKANIIP